MKEKPFNRCMDCGKFIAYKDFESGEARMSMVSPDSEYSIEEYEVQCKRCNPNSAYKPNCMNRRRK